MGCILRAGVRAWSSGRLPYTIDESGFSPSALTNIEKAIEHWNEETDWIVEPRRSQRDYVMFRVGDMCSSPIGRQGGRQHINLANNCGLGASIHEIGHAIGFYHEQNRSDRDNRVVVMPDRVESNRTHNFTKVSAKTVQDHGEYDYRSIMHYGRKAFVKSKRYRWGSGWTTAKAFEIGGKHFLFRLAASNGEMRINRLDRMFGVSHEIERDDWTTGWTTARFFERSGTTYLFLLKERTGTVNIHRMNPDGTVGRRVQSRNLSGGWTTAEFWTAGATTYLFMLKASDGIVRSYRINATGTIGAEVENHDWSSGWTTVRMFSLGDRHYMFHLKESSGIAHIHEMGDDGKVGVRTDLQRVAKGWTNAEFFTSGDRTYLFLLKAGNGDVRILRIGDDATIGSLVDSHDWSSGWTTSEIYPFGSTNYLLLVKGSSGLAHLREMKSSGSVGPELEITPAITIYAPKSIGQRRGLSVGDVAAANDRI